MISQCFAKNKYRENYKLKLNEVICVFSLIQDEERKLYQ